MVSGLISIVISGLFSKLNKEINFLDIYKITEQIFDSYVGLQNPTIDDIINEDEKVRVQTRELIKSMRAVWKY